MEPTLPAFFVNELGDSYSKPTMKQHLAAIRMPFCFCVTGGILRVNTSMSARGAMHVEKWINRPEGHATWLVVELERILIRRVHPQISSSAGDWNHLGRMPRNEPGFWC